MGRWSYIVESNGQFYVRDRRHLKRSAEVGNPSAVEEPLSLTTDDKPAMKPVVTSSVNQKTVNCQVDKEISFNGVPWSIYEYRRYGQLG